MRAVIVSNINMFKLENRLGRYRELYQTEGYGTWIQELLKDRQEAKDYHYVICLIDGTEFYEEEKSAEENERKIEEYFGYMENAVSRNKDLIYLISDIDIIPEHLRPIKETPSEPFLEHEWAKKLKKLSETYPNCYPIAMKRLVSELGRKQAYSEKMWYLSSSRFSNGMEKALTEEILRMLDGLEGKRKKCLLLDLDNTLWGGLAGEDGVEGIQLSATKEGARYKDFQRKIKDLKNMGILLGIVSKNNEEDVREIFEKHADMVLQWEDFAVKKINWDNKAENIGQIKEELNLGWEAFVFVDDNPVERELIRRALPEVTVAEFPADTSRLPSFTEELQKKYFYVPQVTEEDKKKTELYQQRQQRKEESRKFLTVEDYLESLQTVIRISRLQEEQLGRALQLIQKTNQFNLTGKRYQEWELRELLEDNACDVYVMEVIDRFGSNGECILLIVKHTGTEEAEIDSFIMSCRVMGRCLEHSVLNWLEEYYRNRGIQRIQAFYHRTAKNVPVENLYERMGYTLIKEERMSKTYRCKLEEAPERREFAKTVWKEEGMEK